MTGPGGGDPAAARDLFAALLPVFERVLGLEHPHTLVTLRVAQPTGLVLARHRLSRDLPTICQ